MQQVRKDIDSRGWHVVKVMGSIVDPAYAYTIGLHASYGHPELIIFGLSNLRAMHTVLNRVAQTIADGKTYDTGVHLPEAIKGMDCRVLTVAERTMEHHVPLCVEYYGELPGAPMLQLFWTDADGKFPWDPGAEPLAHAHQPKLAIVPGAPRWAKWPFTSPRSRLVLTTDKVLHGAPVRLVIRESEREWQFLCETTLDAKEARLIDLGWMLDQDPSLQEVAELAVGDAWSRERLKGPWTPLPDEE